MDAELTEGGSKLLKGAKIRHNGGEGFTTLGKGKETING